MSNKTFTVVGITEKDGASKVRFANDIVRRVKQFSGPENTRATFVELPNEMTKIEALRHMLTMDEFKSDDDQALISDTLDDKQRDAKKGTVRVTKPGLSLDAIKNRPRVDTTVEDILGVMTN